eukprot:m.271791 g.271791  ORF g.271791 m.271791 type:complete len:79 (+) comp15683_c21_seq3:4005-4241(+)
MCCTSTREVTCLRLNTHRVPIRVINNGATYVFAHNTHASSCKHTHNTHMQNSTHVIAVSSLNGMLLTTAALLCINKPT